MWQIGEQLANSVIKMPRKPMNEDDPLVPKQVSLPLSLKRYLKEAANKSGKSESEIVRDALASELRKTCYRIDLAT